MSNLVNFLDTGNSHSLATSEAWFFAPLVLKLILDTKLLISVAFLFAQNNKLYKYRCTVCTGEILLCPEVEAPKNFKNLPKQNLGQGIHASFQY